MKIELDLDLRGRALVSGLLRKEIERLESIIDSYEWDRSSCAFKVLKSNFESTKNIYKEFNDRRSN